MLILTQAFVFYRLSCVELRWLEYRSGFRWQLWRLPTSGGDLPGPVQGWRQQTRPLWDLRLRGQRRKWVHVFKRIRTLGFRYNTSQYIATWHATIKHRRCKARKYRWLNAKETYRNYIAGAQELLLRMSITFVKIWRKIDCVITAPSCIWTWQNRRMSRQAIRCLLWVIIIQRQSAML